MKTATRTCDTCQEAAPLQAFQKVGRGYRTTCNPCLDKPAATDPQPDAPELDLKIDPGYGIEAWAQEGVLHLRQYDSEGHADTIALSRTEAKVLFAQFQEWVNP